MKILRGPSLYSEFSVQFSNSEIAIQTLKSKKNDIHQDGIINTINVIINGLWPSRIVQKLSFFQEGASISSFLMVQQELKQYFFLCFLYILAHRTIMIIITYQLNESLQTKKMKKRALTQFIKAEWNYFLRKIDKRCCCCQVFGLHLILSSSKFLIKLLASF